MPRAKKGAAANRAKKRLFRAVKGNIGGRRRLLRTARETLRRSMANATRDRRVRKREFRSLWILRVNAAARERGLTYSRFIQGLGKANIQLDRKMLAEIAVSDPKGFDAIVEAARGALAS